MFIRKKKNKSGVISVQLIDKSSGKYVVHETIGSSSDEKEVAALFDKGKLRIKEIARQQVINFDVANEKELVDLFFNGIKSLRLLGPELLLGKIFDEIGFGEIKDRLFRHLVLARLCYPASKLKTTDYIFKYQGLNIDVESVYRYLDKLHSSQKKRVQQISYEHTLKILNNQIGLIFYDVTTLYFEAEQEDEMRKAGFSKDGKHQHPQIVLGLLTSAGGYPLAYDIFEGNKFEGHTMLPVINGFKECYKIENLVVVADAGLMSAANIEELQTNQYQYIIGARIKNETRQVQEQILALGLKNGESTVIQKTEQSKIIISYSQARARKDAANRKRGLEKLEKSIEQGKLTKKNINNRGYNKYLKLEGQMNVTIDKQKYEADAKWDGLKGYMTNTQLSKDLVIENYMQLWQIEKAFRIPKTDLRIRPIYHRLRHRIEAHICICFCAYKIYKELERQLQLKKAGISPEKAIDIVKTIYQITIQTPLSNTEYKRLFLDKNEQTYLLSLFNL